VAYKIDKLYTYIVTHDSGFSPNPFWGTCTLACCKPKIRHTVGRRLKESPSDGIWIVGLSPKHYEEGNDIIFIMQVKEAMTFSEYWNQHPEKRPDFAVGKPMERRGDNIYQPENSSGYRFRQIHSAHSITPSSDDGWEPNPETMSHDLGGEYVLLADKFIYFGSAAIKLPSHLRELIAGRGHKCNFGDDTFEYFSEFLESRRSMIEAGTVVAHPHIWSGHAVMDEFECE